MANMYDFVDHKTSLGIDSKTHDRENRRMFRELNWTKATSWPNPGINGQGHADTVKGIRKHNKQVQLYFASRRS